MMRRMILALALLGWAGASSLAHGESEAALALRQVVRLRSDLEVVREDQQRLYGMLQENRQLLEGLQRQLANLSRQVESAAAASGGDAALRREIEVLRRALREESAARQRAVESVIDSLSREMAALAASRGGGTARPVDSGGSREWSGPVQGEYTVVRGDTLSTIAQAFGITANALREANNLRGDLIREGQVLVIPQRQ